MPRAYLSRCTPIPMFSFSACSCCDAIVFGFLRPLTTAGVACHSVLVTTTAQFAPQQRLWGGGVRSVCREGLRVSLNVRVQDMDLTRRDAEKSWRMVCRSSSAHSWLPAQQ